MTLDGITLNVIVKELSVLQGAKIEKIYQPERDEIVLLLHTTQGKKRLVLSANANDCRMHLTHFQKENPKQAPPFCMLLRKYLTSGRIAGITQAGFERIVEIALDTKDEMGIARCLKLMVEIMGRYSNIILIDETGRVLDSLKHVAFDVSSIRQILPGMQYELPPMHKYDPTEASIQTLADVLYQGTKPLEARLLDKIQGMSGAAAEEILYRRFGTEIPKDISVSRAESVAASIKTFYEEALTAPNPTMQMDMQGKPVFYSVLPYGTYASALCETFETANTLVDAYYQRRADIFKLEQSKQGLQKIVKKHLTRLQKKAKIQLETIEEAKQAEDIRKRGELITANIYRLKRGMRSFEAEDYYTGTTVQIALDPTLTPSANSAKLFKRYNKLKTAEEIAKKQYAVYAREIKYLESEEYHISAAETLAELEDIRTELKKTGYIEEPRTKKGKADRMQSKPTAYLSSDGIQIYAGKNNKQNDSLTLRLARETDTWLHAKDMPGSHVIICAKTIPDQTLEEAATIAATLSKGRFAGKVPVDYTQVKNVKKPSGAKPGMVIYDHYNTIIATPNERLVKRLKQTE